MSTMITRKKIIALFTTMAISLLIVISISYIIMCRMTYHPDATYFIKGKSLSTLAQEKREWLIKEHGAKVCKFKNRDGIILSGLLIERKNPQATLFLCHGYHSSKEGFWRFATLFPSFNLFFFDFRAHGESSGEIITFGCHEYKDVLAASKYLKSNINLPQNKKIPTFIIGISMGGAAAIKATKFDSSICDALIIDSSFTDLKTTLYTSFPVKSSLPSYPFLPVMEKMLDYFGNCNITNMKPINHIKKIQQPIFFIHSCSDIMIPANNSIRMYKEAKNKNSKIWIGPKCRHGYLHIFHPKKYKKKILSFFKKIKE